MSNDPQPLSTEEISELTPKERALYFRGLNVGIVEGYARGVTAVQKRLMDMSPTLTTSDTLLESLELTIRTLNCLKRVEVRTIGELMEYAASNDLLAIQNLSQKNVDEVRSRLDQLGYTLPSVD